jgi:putative heme-binding domain-containing protein
MAEFELNGWSCKLVSPAEPAPGRPWIWRARFWGHEPQTDIALLRAGFHVAYVDVGNLYGSPKAVARWDAFYDYLTSVHHLAPYVSLEGMSRGGLIIYNWAAAHPERVSCTYGDAPVCDFKSWPGGKGKSPGSPADWQACLNAYELTEAEALTFGGNPVDQLAPLARAGVPLLHVVGEADEVVPVAENSDVVESRYRQLGGSIQVIRKPGVGHHPHSLADPKPIVDFVIEHTNRRYAISVEGDLERGRQVFASDQAQCAKCHSIDGSSSAVGPDLQGVGDRMSREQLLMSIIEPSRTLAPGYMTTLIETDQGELLSGILLKRDVESIHLKNNENQIKTVATAHVAQQRRSEVSLMPQGLLATLTPDDAAALVRYLKSLQQPSHEQLAIAGMPTEITELQEGIQFTPVHPDNLRFDKPVFVVAIPGSDQSLLILEHRTGKIWRLAIGSPEPEKLLFADLHEEVSDGPWEGLVCVAFHPAFQTNRRYFVKHEQLRDNRRFTRIVEQLADPSGLLDSGTPSRELIAIEQPADNHNGGTIAFGPDGMLYFAMGDGGPQRDPNGNSQNRLEFLGSLMRIDVDRRDDQRGYGIPPDNPWVNQPQRSLPEVWATGFREPWRFSFDPATGDLWLGDVGQEKYEEVTIVRAGENHGWNVFEGFVPYSDQYRREDEHYTPPVFCYPRKFGVSVTGGHVYRGQQHPSYHGTYIFGDFESRRVWGLTQRNRVLTHITQLGTAPDKIASFGVDHQGELLLVGYEQGMVYRVVLADGHD